MYITWDKTHARGLLRGKARDSSDAAERRGGGGDVGSLRDWNDTG